MNELKFVKEINDSTVMLAINGEIDIFNIGEIRNKLTELTEGYTVIEIDLSNLNFIDSTGLSMLIGLVRDLKGKNGNVVLISPKPQVMKLLKTTGLNTVFEVRREDDYSA